MSDPAIAIVEFDSIATGIYAGYESIARLSDPPKIDYI